MTHPSEASEPRLVLPRPVMRAARWCVSALLVALPLSQVQAAVPAPDRQPDFESNPRTFTNRYAPFQEGAVKVYAGTAGSAQEVVVDDYLPKRRIFQVEGVNDGKPVHCSILREMSFEDGQLVESTLNYFAQADDGTVYYFGELVDMYQNGVVTSHEGSWLVGGPEDSDPSATATSARPFVFMPATPEKADVFKPEDLLPVVDETAQVVDTHQTRAVPAGQYQDVIQVLESSELDTATENKWYAPGVGAISIAAQDEQLDLIASTLRSP